MLALTLSQSLKLASASNMPLAKLLRLSLLMTLALVLAMQFSMEFALFLPISSLGINFIIGYAVG